MDSKKQILVDNSIPNMVGDIMAYILKKNNVTYDIQASFTLPNTVISKQDIAFFKSVLDAAHSDLDNTLHKLNYSYSQELMANLSKDIVINIRSSIGLAVLLNLPLHAMWNEMHKAAMEKREPDCWDILHQVWNQYAIEHPPKPMTPPDINAQADTVGKESKIQ